MNLVPFALENSSQQFVSVQDVPRGLACNCTCPSCKTPLEARQGTEKAWHFAHHTRNNAKETKKECEFSFFVSVTQMLKQLLTAEGELTLKLPEYRLQNARDAGFCTHKQILITTAHTVQLEARQTGVDFEGIHADIYSEVRGEHSSVPLLITFSHKQRPFEPAISPLQQLPAGLIELDITATEQLLQTRHRDSFTTRLKNWLENDSSQHIYWHHHPRKAAKITEAQQKQEATTARHPKKPPSAHSKHRQQDITQPRPVQQPAASKPPARGTPEWDRAITRALQGFQPNS